jgi:hypothetical protein
VVKLPNADRAIIKTEKLLNYILSTDHPEGKFKAAFFRKFGYQSSNWESLEKDFRKLILSHHTADVETAEYGTKYVVEGSLASPSGETIQVVTVWVILKGENVPRFVTAYSGGAK